MAIVEGGATLAMAATVLPAAAILGDHRAMLWVLIAHALSFTALSHGVARGATVFASRAPRSSGSGGSARR
jgi:hypothetical protein